MDITRRIYLFFVGIIFLGFCGFAPENITEVETAVLKADYKSGEAMALKFLAENPEKEFADKINYYLGLCYLRQGKYSSARDVFKKIISPSLDKDTRDKVFLGLYDSYYMQENYNEALKIIKEALFNNPKSNFLSLMYFKCARVSLKLAHWGEAQTYFEKIIKNFPQSLEADLAKQFLDEKRYFSVQVGSFKDQGKSEEFLSGLKQKGYYVYIIETADKQNNKYYRVRVGQFSKLEEAQNLKSELSGQGYPTQIYP